MANKTIPQYTAAATIDGANDYMLEYQASVSAYRKLNRNTLMGVSGQPADISTAQNITNKTLDNTNIITILDSNLTLQDNVDSTKQAQFQLSGNTTGTTRTYTMPNASVTLASLTGTETLTNKTITSPAITGGTIDNSTITVDSISGHSTSTIVTVGGVQMNNGTIGTSGAVTSTAIASGAVTPNSLIASTGTGWSWQSFTPSWTNLTPGNGTVTARYTQIGKMVWIFLTFVMGSTSAISGDVSFLVPVTASSLYTTIGVNGVIGYGNLFANTVSAIATVYFASTNTAIHIGQFSPSSTSNTLAVLGATSPGTWTTNGQLTITCFYEAA